jgi:hypothetical protein
MRISIFFVFSYCSRSAGENVSVRMHCRSPGSWMTSFVRRRQSASRSTTRRFLTTVRSSIFCSKGTSIHLRKTGVLEKGSTRMKAKSAPMSASLF